MRNASRYTVALVAALGLLPVALDTTIINVATIPISQALHSTIDTIQWIFLGYLLSNAATVPLAGYLGSRIGNKRTFLLGTAFFTLFSLLCGLTTNIAWLVAFRVLQGIAGGLLTPLAMAIGFQPFAQEERAKAMAIIGVPALLAPVVGPIIGGLIIEHLNWQSIFLVNLPVGLFSFVLAWLALPADHHTADRQAGAGALDYPGLILSMAGVAVLVYAFKLVSQTNPLTRSAATGQGSIYGWSYWPVWALAGCGVLLLAAFAYRSLRSPRTSILDLRLFAERNFTVGNLAIWLSSIVTLGLLFLLPVYLQSVRMPHLSPLETGVAMMPMGIATIVGMILGGGLYKFVGARPLVLAGTVLLALGCWQFRSLTPDVAISALRFPLALVGLSTTLIVVPTNTLALGALRGEALNKASSLISATKLLVASIGSAALVTVYIQDTASHAAQLAAQATSSQALGVKAQLAAQAATAGMVDLFTLLLWSMILLVVVALLLPGRHRKAT